MCYTIYKQEIRKPELKYMVSVTQNVKIAGNSKTRRYTQTENTFMWNSITG